MTVLSFLINKNYAFELSLLRLVRRLSDGITFCEFKCSWDRYESDHKPSLDVSLLILNLMVFELNIYSIHHNFS